MRFLSVFALLGSAAALSGCVPNEALLAAGTPCAVTAANINCAPPPVTTTTTPTTTTTTTTTTDPTVSPTGTPIIPNTGNNTTFTTGDTTLILEKSILQIDPVTGKYKPGVSKFTEAQGQTAMLQINTNTADNTSWPIPKTMVDYPRGTGVNQGLMWDPALGGVYNAYRAYSADGVDEELQVWHFKNSYATQYRDVSGGGADAKHQAWSFGGNHTTAAGMPTAGTVNYLGKFGATAKTLGYVNAGAGSQQTVDFNNLWRVNGDSAATANFGTGAFSGVLTPRYWIGQDINNSSFVEVDNTVPTITYVDDKGVSHTIDNPNLRSFMSAKINLKGTITGNAITGGTAQFDTASGLVTNQTTNAMYGGFFGATANEVTGAFALDAMDPVPYGGFAPINNDRRAYIQMSGIYNLQ